MAIALVQSAGLTVISLGLVTGTVPAISSASYSSIPAMHDACEDLGQNYLKADIIQSLVLADL